MIKLSKLLCFNLFVSLFLCSSCTYLEPYTLDMYDYIGLEPDNIFEEVGEYAVKLKTGIDKDITPSTPEQ